MLVGANTVQYIDVVDVGCITGLYGGVSDTSQVRSGASLTSRDHGTCPAIRRGLLSWSVHSDNLGLQRHSCMAPLADILVAAALNPSNNKRTTHGALTRSLNILRRHIRSTAVRYRFWLYCDVQCNT